MDSQNVHPKKTKMVKVLNGIERVGNKLPDPFMLFVYLAASVIVISWMVSQFNVSFIQPGVEEKVYIQNLMSAQGLQYMLESMLENFVTFKPLGIVLGMMLGVGLADKVGLLETAIKSTIVKAPKALVTYAVVFTGILGNIASDAAFVIVPPLAAMVFYNVGRHPLAGLAAGFAGVGSGYTANFMITGADALLSGISTEVMESLQSEIVVTPVDNWYFMVTSVFILSIVGAFVTEKIVEPRLGHYTGTVKKAFTKTKPIEMKGLTYATCAGLIYIVVIVTVLLLPNSPLTNEDGGIASSPFLSGIVPIILIFFIIIGVTYGVTLKKIENTRAIGQLMGEAMKDMSGFIVLIFAASQFIAYFEWTNIGSWIAVSGANLLESAGVTGLPVVIGFILLTAVLNLFIFSGSAQWALEAPIFIKMFYFLGYHPAFIQVAYRIADSSTNVITPMNPYIIIILSFMKEYDKKAGIGTLIALMLPYSLLFLATWIMLLILFILCGLPFGPGIGVYV
ncbi:MAG TPA: AbgT family transporter [Bacillota bacterium]